MATLHFSLIRKGLLSEDGQKLTVPGNELLTFIKSSSSEKLKKKKADNSEFDKWWKTFPATDTFEYKGKKFIGSRSLKNSKDDCKLKFEKILFEGEYTADVLIKALEYELLQKLEASIKTNTNKLAYMQNSLTYLRQRTFESYIELMKSGLGNIDNDNDFDGVDI